MPVAQVDGRAIDLETKRRLAKEITDAMERAYGLPRDTYVVFIRENTPDCVGVGGELACDR
ncbi:MAG: tautomerase family protein [Candidatus Geothermincolia bacterium]